MKKLFNIFAIALASTLMFSCQEDADVDNLTVGGTVKGKFSLVVPANEVVDLTRASEEAESDITNVYLFYFDNDHKALNVVSGKNYEEITLGTAAVEGQYTRTYNVTTNASFEDGTVVNVLAIANTNSSLGTLADFTAVATDYEALKALTISLNTLNTPFATMTMSGSLTATASNQYGLTGTINVKRPYAKVNFTIKNGSSNFTFTPTQYNVKNVPTSGAVFEGSQATVQYTDHVGMTNFEESQGAQIIEFFQLENAAGVAANVANYNDREKRKDIEGGNHSEFAHGLANATYVEILGEGKGTNAKGEPISATVKYTIHLGDFTANAGDFNVNRNYWYNYTVTVNGVNSIVVEAESEEMNGDGFQHGAEGTVINLEGSKMVYTLDAHYEQVLLNLNLTALPTGDNDVVLVVSTPYMSEENKGKMITWSMIESADFGQNFDTEWVEFFVSNALVAYPTGNANLMNTVDFLKYVKGLATDGNTANDNLTVVAYINEYFYDANPLTKGTTKWPEFVNKEDRVMRILQEPDISADGYSISTKALCSFTQRSIRTFFNENTVGAYGMEWYEEINTPLTEFSYNGTSKDNGLTNFTNQSLTNKINFANVGYGVDGQPSGNVYTSLSMSDAGYACLARNRSASDIKWYPAAPNQYVAYWFGEASVPNDAKLYKGNPAENLTLADGWGDGGYNYLHHYWTSGPDANKIFWAIEGAAFCPGRYRQYYGAAGAEHKVRCLRNFESTVAKTAEATTLDGSTAIVLKNFNDNAYRGIATEQLPVHHEREAANKLPKAFIVAKENLNATWTAMTETPVAPQIVSIENIDNGIVVKFLNKDTYAYAKSTNGNKTTIALGAENSFTINNPSGTYYFYTKRNYDTYSGYVTVSQSNGVWTANNTVTGTGTSFSISARTSNNKIPLMAAIHQNLCTQYTAEDAKGTAWRLPNQRELLAMFSLSVTGINANTHSSTLYSARNVASASGTIRYGYVWFNTGNGSDGFGMQSYDWGTSNNGYVRCVRDASEAELEALGATNSGDQEDGGEA